MSSRARAVGAGRLGALYAALATALGAFGAHGLEARLEAGELATWETGARYLMYAGLGLFAAAWRRSAAPGTAAGVAFVCLAAGGAIFSGAVCSLALGAPRWLGAVAPLGGSLLIAGFLALAWTFRAAEPPS